MSDSKVSRFLPWVLIAIVAFIFLQSLPYKFSGHAETKIIFMTIGEWMNGLGLSSIGELFGQYGGYLIGSLELVAVILLLLPKTRFYGALLGLGLMSGAIFFHLFTPLGVVRTIDDAGNTDGGVLFIMACIAWVSSAVLAYLNRPGKS
ncbi:hypothetical protein [Kangiella sp. HZ709]|uniref:hypothetical protein n=1 Tax=Kangiella sp. HZ709 TaxID=2666328 RepID=UPI0012B15629|nr:hypothetical protein [Kangiella sp. HZ709]MRX26633.1 hypothetical protein [Kangiella sp. HZ709]